jgi:hypothetical protein
MPPMSLTDNWTMTGKLADTLVKQGQNAFGCARAALGHAATIPPQSGFASACFSGPRCFW